MRAGLPTQWEGVDVAFGTTHTLQMSPRMKCLDVVAQACDLSTKEAEAKGGSLKGKASMVSPRPAWVLGEDLSKTITTTKERKSVWGRVQPRHLPREQGGKTLTVPCHKTVIEYSLD